MELSERCIQTLETEGYNSIDEQQYAPGTILPTVIATSKTAIIVTDGTITVTYSDIVHTLNSSERITIPAQIPYSILVGGMRCQLVVGEMTVN